MCVEGWLDLTEYIDETLHDVKADAFKCTHGSWCCASLCYRDDYAESRWADTQESRMACLSNVFTIGNKHIHEGHFLLLSIVSRFAMTRFWFKHMENCAWVK